jgi:2-keto-4-pentenoate hydratase/2-oxohepta-3-ene-1,7-dioic acid hydratase in catechol pathway
MQLVTLAARAGAGVILGEEIVDLVGCRNQVVAARLLPQTVRGILEAGDGALDLVRRVADDIASNAGMADRLREAGALLRRSGARLLAPVTDPALILSCGMNYREHLREMNTPVPDYPTSFTKNIGALIGPDAPIVLPRANPDMVDWEGEFSVVMGRSCHRVSEADALDYVAGYTLINDVSARDWVAPIFQSTALMAGILAWERNLLGKQFPTFCPMGPVLVTRDEIRDPDDVHIETLLNGQVMQSANTSDLVFSVRKLIAYYSQFYRFSPGDVITTGSPSGVGYGRNPKVFMHAGDRIEVRADGVGVLANPIAAPQPAA